MHSETTHEPGGAECGEWWQSLGTALCLMACRAKNRSPSRDHHITGVLRVRLQTDKPQQHFSRAGEKHSGYRQLPVQLTLRWLILALTLMGCDVS